MISVLVSEERASERGAERPREPVSEIIDIS